MAADESIEDMVNTITSALTIRHSNGDRLAASRGMKSVAPTVRGLHFDEEDFLSDDVDEMMIEEEDEEEDSGYGMEVPDGEEEEEEGTEDGFYDHINSPEMRDIARRRGWNDIADAAGALGGGGGRAEEDPAERAKNLTVVSASGKAMGQHVPRVKYSLQDAFKKIGGANSIAPPLEGRPDIDGESGDEESTSEEEADGSGIKRSRDERDETTQAVVGILKRFGANPSDAVLEQLRDGERVLRRDEHRVERSKKRRRIEGSGPDSDASTSSEQTPVAKRNIAQEREYLRPRYKNSGVEYERFLQTYCPLCGYGDRVNDAIYAPKLAVIREMAETGVMEGDIGTLAHDICTVWNEHIYKPMIAEGRRAMRLTYDMCRHHLLKPHRPDPRPMMRRDIEDLTMLIQIVNATIYTENGLTREGSVDPKMVAASINLYKTKYMIAGKRPETMAFYNPNFNFNERAAGGFVNPYQKVHFGGRRVTRASKR